MIARMFPTWTFFEKEYPTIQHTSHMTTNIQLTANIAPAAAARPLPPLNISHTGKQCPTTIPIREAEIASDVETPNKGDKENCKCTFQHINNKNNETDKPFASYLIRIQRPHVATACGTDIDVSFSFYNNVGSGAGNR